MKTEGETNRGRKRVAQRVRSVKNLFEEHIDVLTNKEWPEELLTCNKAENSLVVYNNNNNINPRSTMIFEKLTVAQLLTKFLTVNGIQTFTTKVCALYLSQFNPIQKL
jgi:hypothetical protein